MVSSAGSKISPGFTITSPFQELKYSYRQILDVGRSCFFFDVKFHILRPFLRAGAWRISFLGWREGYDLMNIKLL